VSVLGGAASLKDKYTGGLLGYEDPSAQMRAKDGCKVLGIHMRQEAIIDGLALVTEKK
jgi:hypothetical protein